MSRFHDRFGSGKIIIGMIHLPPLPGYPKSPGIENIVQHAVADLATLEEGGVHGALIENEHDRPHRISANRETVAAVTRITRAAVQESANTAIGCEILLNDPRSSLACARMAGADFIRTDYFVDRMIRPQYGEFNIDPDGLMQYRQALDADNVLVLADIQVKYAQMIEPRPLADSAQLAVQKGADAIVVSGATSGDAPTVDNLLQARHGAPVLVGSGLTPDNAAELLSVCDGAIVGTSIMVDGKVDPDALELLMAEVPAS